MEAANNSLSGFISEAQFIADVKSRGVKMSARTARNWRNKRKVPFVKIEQGVFYPANWASKLKIVNPK